jgi:cell division protein FtsQ
MIVKRNRGPRNRWPRLVVKRSGSVGERRARTIVKRSNAGAPPPAAGSGVSRAPRFRRAWWALAIGAGSLALLGAAVGVAWRSPLFSIRDVEVQGNRQVPADTLVEKAGLTGENMFTADLAAAQKELYRIPLLASVRIERAWPRGIKIEVTERQPWGTWEQAGVAYTIDRDGIVLGTTPPPQGSPVVRSYELTSLRTGDRVNYQAVDAAAELYAKLPKQLGIAVTEVAFVAGKGVEVTTSRGEKALFGDSSSIAYKIAVWAAMAQQAKALGIKYATIDLRYGNRPVLQ